MSPRMLFPMQLITLITISGVLLSLLFPVGLWDINGFPFTALFILHLLAHSFGVLRSAERIIAVLRADAGGKLIGLLGILPIVLLLIALATLPVIHRDALIHHLAVPSWWITNGAVHDIWWHQWSSYPMLIQLSYAEFLSWGAPELTTLYHASYLFLFAGLLAERRGENEHFGKLEVLLVFSIPLFIRLGSAPYVDLPLAVFGLAFYLGWFKDNAGKRSPAFLLGLLIGLMAATKYNGLLFAAVAAPLFLMTRHREALPFLLGGALTSLPWYLKNWFTHQNPVYPLLPGLFPPQNELLHIPRVGNLEQHMAAPLTAPLEFLSLPFQMLTFGQDNDPAGFDGILSPLLLCFLIPPKEKDKRGRYYLSLVLVGAVFYLTLLLSGPRTRYFAPLFGILVFLAVHGLERIVSLCRPTFQRLLLGGICVIQVTIGVWYVISLSNERDLFRFYSSDISGSDYRNQQVSESLLADAVNSKLPSDSKTYLLYTGNRYFLYQRPIINSGYFSERLILTWLMESNSLEDLMKHIRDEGVTHIAIHTDRYKRSFAEFAEIKFLSEEKLSLWNTFAEQHLIPQYEIGPYQIWQIQ